MRIAKTKGILSRDPEMLSGDLVCAGTRVPVKNLVDYLKADHTLGDFLDGFPGVSREQAVSYLEISMEAADELREREAASPLDARSAR